RQPLPAGLMEDLNRLKDTELRRYITSLRESLGDREELRAHQALLASLGALPRVLDPHCGLIPLRENTQALRALTDNGNPRPEFGVGLELVNPPFRPDYRAMQMEAAVLAEPVPRIQSTGRPPGPLRIKSVTPGSPAQRAGLRPDDLIIRINGQPCEDMTARS